MLDVEEEIHPIFDLPKVGEDNKLPELPENNNPGDLSSMFSTEREYLKVKIESIANMYRNLSKLTEVQIEALTQRQYSLEKKHAYTAMFDESNRRYKKEWKEKLDQYTKRSDRKYTNPQIENMIEGDLADFKRHLEMLAQQANYFDESIRTLDHIIYAVKDRIAYERFIKGDL